MYPLTESTWARTCIDCGNGMNLHLDNINPFCKCRQDGIRLSLDRQEAHSLRANSARSISSRCQSRASSRPPSASEIHARRMTNVTLESTSIASSKKVLLRYTNGGIQRPITPELYTNAHALPRLVRRYIGRRVGQYHELSVSQSSAIFTDAAQLNGALSVVSHGYCSK